MSKGAESRWIIHEGNAYVFQALCPTVVMHTLCCKFVCDDNIIMVILPLFLFSFYQTAGADGFLIGIEEEDIKLMHRIIVKGELILMSHIKLTSV